MVDENDIRSSHILFLLLELHNLAFNAVLDDKSLDDHWPMLTLKENKKDLDVSFPHSLSLSKGLNEQVCEFCPWLEALLRGSHRPERYSQLNPGVWSSGPTTYHQGSTIKTASTIQRYRPRSKLSDLALYLCDSSRYPVNCAILGRALLSVSITSL
jgi:hypothetical protein